MSVTFHRFSKVYFLLKIKFEIELFDGFCPFLMVFQHNLHHIVLTALDRKYVSDPAKIKLFFNYI